MSLPDAFSLWNISGLCPVLNSNWSTIGLLSILLFSNPGAILVLVQVLIGSHSFTFDHVYGSTGSSPSSMYEECVTPLVDALFEGYNATVLAYGQVKCTNVLNSLFFFCWNNEITSLCIIWNITDRFRKDLHHGYWFQRRMPNRNYSPSYECFVQQNWNLEAPYRIPPACVLYWGLTISYFLCLVRFPYLSISLT